MISNELMKIDMDLTDADMRMIDELFEAFEKFYNRCYEAVPKEGLNEVEVKESILRGFTNFAYIFYCRKMGVEYPCGDIEVSFVAEEMF